MEQVGLTKIGQQDPIMLQFKLKKCQLWLDWHAIGEILVKDTSV